MKNIIYSAIALIVIISCSKNDEVKIRCTGFETRESTILNPEEYEVLSAVMTSEKISPYIVSQESSVLDSSTIVNLLGYGGSNGSAHYLGFEADSLVIDAFIKTNLKSEYWGTEFKGETKLITRGEKNCFFEKQGVRGWDDYYRKYSSGIWSFYRPGIYRDYALVNYWYGCGSLCGEGTYLLLQKVEEEWMIIKRGPMIVA